MRLTEPRAEQEGDSFSFSFFFRFPARSRTTSTIFYATVYTEKIVLANSRKIDSYEMQILRRKNRKRFFEKISRVAVKRNEPSCLNESAAPEIPPGVALGKYREKSREGTEGKDAL